MARETNRQLADRILNPTDVRNRLTTTPALEIARLASDYQRARAEGRTEDAAAIKREAMALKAATLGISYEVFEAERAAYEAVTLPPMPQVVASPYCFTAYAADGQCLGEYATYEAAHERAWGTAA